MKKPIVFFSHSSKDQKFLTRLKEMVVEKTGNSIDIFLSSDGESIPLGRNWVHSIQKALEGASLMFVFISPHSLRSNWLFFESGFAYSRDIKVVPVGILGVDLGTLPPPLSLLQGFNVTSADSLGNIIDLLNKTFSHNHPNQFSNSEFKELYPKGEDVILSALGEYSMFVKNIIMNIMVGFLYNIDVTMDKTIQILKSEQLEFQKTGMDISAHGLMLNNSWSSKKKGSTILLDPILTLRTFPLVEKILNTIRVDGILGVEIELLFVRSVRYIVESPLEQHKFTARLYDTDVKLKENSIFFKECFSFEIKYLNHTLRSRPKDVFIIIKCNSKTFSGMKLDEFLNLLFERGILYVEE
jgi:hypothetical protein